MREEQQYAIARYLGCKFEQAILQSVVTKTLDAYHLNNFDFCIEPKLLLKDLASLTQEDFDRMSKENYPDEFEIGMWDVSDFLDEGRAKAKDWDWLRNHSYYLGEESIEQFVKMQE